MAPDFSKRSDAIEVMDDLNSSGEVINQTLVELEVINKWLGGNAVTLNGLHLLLSSSTKITRLKITDLGCGGGDMLKLLAARLKKSGMQTTLVGIDANPNIIEYAQENAKAFTEISFQTQDILSESFRSQPYDIVFATLFFHHFTSAQLVEIFKSLKKQSAVGIVINDLHRHWLAYYSIKFLTRFFSKSTMVRHDAPLSVLRGFSKNELIEILQQAGIKNYSLKWKWAFRWQLVIPA
jgi:2-polyprenyl-3-methyl-5-hydroxy-6-metoxy-1,4-benzoquinol methylase